jgi:hypothetical protein
MSDIEAKPEMTTPDVTPMQLGAGGIFAGVASGCLLQGVTGVDLLAYLGTAAIVTGALVIADAVIRSGRARGAGAINNYRNG